MIKSMTGYGSAKGQVDGLSVTVELRSVNNRFLDCSVRLPKSFLFAEETVRACVAGKISRGKVDVFVTVDSTQSSDLAVKVNQGLLKGYLEAIGQIADQFGLPMDLSASAAARLPDVLVVEKRELDSEALARGIREITDAALDDFDRMRQREGDKLRQDVLNRLETIEGLVGLVEEKSPETVREYRKRLENKMMEVLGTSGIDESRILTEAAIFADKVAVDEETVRLRSHIDQLRGMIEAGSPIGRKIDFLIQEFNREANTVASKCQNSEIAYAAVAIKAEIEKIREQIQNIE